MTQISGGTTTLYAMRAEQLAAIYLTRRDDLRVVAEPTSLKSGRLDILVSITHDERKTPRLFAVEVKARLDASHRYEVLRDAIQQGHRQLFLGMPVCLFFFAMKNDEGFYTWLVKPEITENGRPVLRLSEYDANREHRPRFEELTDCAIDEIVQRVDEWYDLKDWLRSTASIAVPISKKKFASMASGSNEHEIDIDRSFPNWVEEIQEELDQNTPRGRFEVFPLEGEEDGGKEIMTADRGAVEIVNAIVANVWHRRSQWAVRVPKARSRGV